MKINMKRSELKRLLAAVKLVVPARSTVAVLQHVLLRAESDRVTIHATNLEEYLQGVAEAVIEEPGSVLVPMQTLKDLAKGKAGDQVSIMLTSETELTITSPVAGQEIRQQVQTIAVTEWSEMPAVDAEMQTIDTAEMLCAYARVLPAISTDATRYALHGVYAELPRCP